MITKEQQLLLDALRELRLKRGQPSLRSITESSGGMVSYTAIADILNGVRLPRWKTLAAITAVLGGDSDEFYRLWEMAWLARPGTHEAEEKLGLALAANLDILLYSVAGASAGDRELVSQCKRCRNSLLYLMRPGGVGLERVVQGRLRALPITHEGHDDEQSFDDAVPQFT